MIEQKSDSADKFTDGDFEYADDFNAMPDEVREHSLNAEHLSTAAPKTSQGIPEANKAGAATAAPAAEIPGLGINDPAETTAVPIPPSVAPPATTTEDASPAKPVIKKKEKPVPDTSVMRVGAWMGTLILLMIPIFNLFCVIQWAFSRNINRNKKNLGMAGLLLFVIFIVLFVLVCLIAQKWYNLNLVASIWNKIKGI